MIHTQSQTALHNRLNNASGGVFTSKEITNGWQYKLVGGAIVNWFPSTGKLTFQGNAALAERVRNNLQAQDNDHKTLIDEIYILLSSCSPSTLQAIKNLIIKD